MPQALVHADPLRDLLLQKCFDLFMQGDGLVQHGVGAGAVGAHADQVAAAFIARIQLLELARLLLVFMRGDRAGRRLAQSRGGLSGGNPGGRSYDHPPINANEAEARRASRFEPHGHTGGRLDIAALRDAGRRAFSADYPHTLDLRRAPAQ